MAQYRGNQPADQNKGLTVVAILLAVAVVVVLTAIAGVLIHRFTASVEATTAAVTQTVTATTKREASTTKRPKTTKKYTTTTKKVTTTLPPLRGVTDCDLETYNVGEREGGGFAGAIIKFQCNDDCDGYELRTTYGYGEEWETVRTARFNRNHHILYFGTQEDYPMVEIRSYRGNPKNGNAAYSDWYEVCNWKLANWSNEGFIYYEDWQVLTRNGYCIDDLMY